MPRELLGFCGVLLLPTNRLHKRQHRLLRSPQWGFGARVRSRPVPELFEDCLALGGCLMLALLVPKAPRGAPLPAAVLLGAAMEEVKLQVLAIHWELCEVMQPAALMPSMSCLLWLPRLRILALPHVADALGAQNGHSVCSAIWPRKGLPRIHECVQCFLLGALRGLTEVWLPIQSSRTCFW